jgi:hypothetical protein
MSLKLICTGLFFCILLLPIRLKAQPPSYFDIEVAHVKVGNLVTERIQKDSLTFYIFTSEVDAWLFVRIKVSHLITCVYKKDKLIRADIHSIINKEKYISHVEWKQDHYEYDCSTYKYHKSGTLKENIDFSVVKMYFEEPVGKQKMFAENYGIFARMLLLKPSVYRLEVEKNKNTFYYTQSVLQRVDMDTPLLHYTIKRKK